MQFIQVRPVARDTDGSLRRAFEGDEVAAWGVYETDASGLPMWVEDYDTRSGAAIRAVMLSRERHKPLLIDELNGRTVGFGPDAVALITTN